MAVAKGFTSDAGAAAWIVDDGDRSTVDLALTDDTASETEHTTRAHIEHRRGDRSGAPEPQRDR